MPKKITPEQPDFENALAASLGEEQPEQTEEQPEQTEEQAENPTDNIQDYGFSMPQPSTMDKIGAGLAGLGEGLSAAQAVKGPNTGAMQAGAAFKAAFGMASGLLKERTEALNMALERLPLSDVSPALAKKFPSLAGMPSKMAYETIRDIQADTRKLSMIRASEQIKTEEQAASWYREHEGDYVNDKNADAVISMIRANIPDSPLKKEDIKGMKISDFGQFINKSLITADSKEERWRQTEWAKLARLTNPNNAMRGSLIGTAGLLNARAERALDRLRQNKLTPQEIDAITTDIAGIMQGGAPHEAELRAQGVHNLVRSLSETLAYFKSEPQYMQMPEWKAKLTEIVRGIKEVDNNIIRNNLDINETAYKTLIDKDPERWATYKSKILKQLEEPETPKATPIAEGTTATKLINGKPVQLTFTKGVWTY